MKIWTVDAFASKSYASNPAAVIIVDEFPTDKQYQDLPEYTCRT